MEMIIIILDSATQIVVRVWAFFCKENFFF